MPVVGVGCGRSLEQIVARTSSPSGPTAFPAQHFRFSRSKPMTTLYQFRSISAKTNWVVLFTLALLFLSVSVVSAQDNTNTNANTSSTTVNANANASSNTNQNQNGNGNVNASSRATPTPDPNVEHRRNRLLESYWYYIIVILMFAVVLVPFAWTIMRSIKYSSATYRSPLGLPDGSLRAMLAFTLVAFVGFYVLASILSFSNFEPPQFLLGIVATVIGFYFGSRSSEEKAAGGTAGKTGGLQGNVSDETGAAAAGADVQLTQEGVQKGTTKTDDKGQYKFEKLATGDYVVKATRANLASDPTQVKIEGGAPQKVLLTLK
jgi:Carboxypeptidase regulatory-like domain